jgi:NADPH:quinone reductase-like Zn-dependent oxidoreductase
MRRIIMGTMKALRFGTVGDIGKVLHVEAVERPVPRVGEVLIEVHAASINPFDVKNVQGSFPKTTLPRIPGRDLAGVIIAGDDQRIGEEVWATGGDIGTVRDGSHAEYIAIQGRGARPKPRSLSMAQAASVGTNYMAAFLGLIQKAQLKENETVLVTGASGGVGSSVVKIAKTRAARVITVDRKVPAPDKVRERSIDLALSSESDDIATRVKEFTGGTGVSVVFDCVGGPLFEVAMKTLGMNGRQVNITSVGTPRVSFDLLDFYRRALTLFGVNTTLLDTIGAGEILDGLRPAFEEGQLTSPDIARTFFVEQAIEAYEQIAGGTAKGKMIIVFKE